MASETREKTKESSSYETKGFDGKGMASCLTVLNISGRTTKMKLEIG